MSKIAVYTITSGLHDENAVRALSDEFLTGVFPDGDYEMRGADFSDFGSFPLSLIYIRTGGAEGIFKSLLPGLLQKGARRFYLLTSGKSNSLAASLEILSYLRQNGLEGEVLHGSNAYVSERISTLNAVGKARMAILGTRIGVVGKPSDWLIASAADPSKIWEQLGVTIVDIPMEEFLEAFRSAEGASCPDDIAMKRDIRTSWNDAERIYSALKSIVSRHSLGALTVRCFDLLTSVGNTGCLALARLNAEGIPASCEGDVPALLSMMISKALTGHTGFQANPARIDTGSGQILFAHCTIPLDIVSECTFDTHFESGIGVGIHGHFPEGPVTVFKVSGDLSRRFVSEGELIANSYEDNLCRTQVTLRIPPEDARYFLTDPIGNHHIIIPGHWKDLLSQF